eukprot:NODE_3843_length_887_cov_29.584211_g3690_i0.p1 GENE.NODE_3843_length_887_cov_29.584211_g3690_i0~~NODE_3843_length_887_cov_29.584211_g3690_i0.p1  ORF type:complete len:263 (+),score=86.79 NODE_3843_length_887_cov_29.584211_g3690_i0:43-789(+)
MPAQDEESSFTEFDAMQGTHKQAIGGPLDKVLWALCLLLTVGALAASVFVFAGHDWRVVRTELAVPTTVCTGCTFVREQHYGLFHIHVKDVSSSKTSETYSLGTSADDWNVTTNPGLKMWEVLEHLSGPNQTKPLTKERYDQMRSSRQRGSQIIVIAYVLGWLITLFGFTELRKLGSGRSTGKGTTLFPQCLVTASLFFIGGGAVYFFVTIWTFGDTTLGEPGRSFWIALGFAILILVLGVITQCRKF